MFSSSEPPSPASFLPSSFLHPSSRSEVPPLPEVALHTGRGACIHDMYALCTPWHICKLCVCVLGPPFLSMHISQAQVSKAHGTGCQP